ncbi:uncharacterized protein [Littorina saxatilis]|uniref:uncharacterized protein n=1 Tax=Littorina saxatilis TaxID=31220 RepID=UPI0038B49D09
MSCSTTVLLTSVVGVYSCLRQDTGLLYCYSMMGYVLALVELLYFLSLYIHLGRATASTKTCFKEVLVRDYSGPYQSDIFNSSGAWDFMHRHYRCCGVDQGEVFNSMVNWDRTWIERYEDPFFNTTLKLDEFKVIAVLPYTCCVFKNEEDVYYSPDASVENLRGALQDENCPFTPTTSNSYIQVGCFDLLHLFVSNMTTFAFYVSLIAESFQLTAAVCALYSSRAIMNSRTLEKLMHNRHI